MRSPTQKSLEKLRKDGYLCAIVEIWNQFAGKRQDLYGFLDLLCLKESEILGIQTTSQTNMQARVEKILKHKNYLPVKKSGIKIIVHGWQKVKKGKRLIYECKVIKL